MTVRLIPKVPQEIEDAMTWAGFALRMVQHAEEGLSVALRITFHSAPAITAASLAAEEDTVRRKTLGQLLRELRRRVTIADDFDTFLSEFLAHRNDFVHGKHSVLLDSVEGAAEFTRIASKLSGEASHVAMVLASALLAFADELEATQAPGTEPLFPGLDAVPGAATTYAELRAMAPAVQASLRRKP